MKLLKRRIKIINVKEKRPAGLGPFLGLFVIIGTGIAGFFVHFYLHSEEKTFNSNYSNVLFHFTEQIEIITIIDNMYKELLAEDFGDKIKPKLRSIQNKIASIRRQTEIYEKLERIPKGPANFMKTSLRELDKIIREDILPLDAEVQNILDDSVRQLLPSQVLKKRLVRPRDYFGTFGKGYPSCTDKLVIDTHTDSEIHKDYVKFTQGSLTLSDIGKKLGNMVLLNQECESYLIPGPNQEAREEKLEEYKTKISRDIKKNGKYYKLVSRLTNEYIDKIMEMRKQRMKKLEENRVSYMDLRNEIVKKEVKEVESLIRALAY